uniref:NTP_transf_2 domain-containing protein n=1 Tax=Caenorhabditis japonica TaxID=281687 RepID=A0A8R1HWR0_CAEJA
MIKLRVSQLPRIAQCSYSTECSSSSNTSKPSPTLSYTDLIKLKYPEKLQRMNEQIDELNSQRKLCKNNSKVSHFIKDLNSLILNKNRAELLPVGSMVTKFVNKQSDFDFVFFPNKGDVRKQFLRDFHQNPSFKQNFMSVFAKLIVRESEKLGDPVEKIVELPRMRVPLIIVRYSSGLSIDIQFPEENYHAIRNTHLMRTYKTCDNRFTLLFLWLRAVCDKLEVRNSKYGLLSSYHLLLLVVHFLQSEQALSPWPVLPVLSKTHVSLVTPDIPISKVAEWIKNDPPSIEWNSHNKMPISELIIRFVDYYSHFNPAKEAIYIGKGLASKRKQVFGDVRLQLIDPYSPVSVCRSSHATAAFFAAIQFIRRQFKNGRMLASLPEVPEAAQFLRENHFSSWRTQMNDKIIL